MSFEWSKNLLLSVELARWLVPTPLALAVLGFENSILGDGDEANTILLSLPTQPKSTHMLAIKDIVG